MTAESVAVARAGRLLSELFVDMSVVDVSLPMVDVLPWFIGCVGVLTLGSCRWSVVVLLPL